MLVLCVVDDGDDDDADDDDGDGGDGGGGDDGYHVVADSDRLGSPWLWQVPATSEELAEFLPRGRPAGSGHHDCPGLQQVLAGWLVRWRHHSSHSGGPAP